MKTFITQKQNWKKIVLAALATALVAPLATPSAQAAPPDHAPAYGYRNKADKKAKKNKNVIRDRNDDGYDDRDRDRDGDLDEEDGYDYRETPRYQKQYGDDYYYNESDSRDFRDSNRNGIDDRYENGRGGTFSTVIGVVTQDLSGRRFEIRSNNRTYVVIARNSEPLRLTTGDTVTVSGRVFRNVRTNRNNTRNNIRNNAMIIADRVVINRNDDRNQNGSRVNFTGRVQDVVSDRELIVRSSDGRTLRVRTNFALSSSISDGDRVTVAGRLQNGVVTATRVNLAGNNNNNDYDNDNNGDNINFTGRVQSSTSIFGRRILVVRADNGTTYRVRTNDASDFDKGDRVRVSGDLRNGIVTADDIDRI